MDALVVAGVVVVLAGGAAVLAFRFRRRSQTDRKQQQAPWSRSEKLSLAGIVAGAAMSGAGLLLAGDDGAPKPNAASGASPSAVAALVRQGPFTAKLPEPLVADGLTDVQIGDESAVDRIDAVQLQAHDPSGVVDAYFAHIEVYREPAAARARSKARMQEIARRYGSGQLNGSPTAYCAYLDPQPSWECGGASGLAYAETTITPNPNATRGLAAGSTAALLRYADEKARVASR